ncbi:type IV pilus biogenesis protein PilM [Bacillus marinisedimentorum]|uniref:type IV pilus biogenesis protein PilM n=1 Tax=Bacillus marinisedimentorum TaxID=1821260 RepID=UPI0008729B57|nr:pilus assembly protein PilM [Bacillus marinisedimentorum]
MLFSGLLAKNKPVNLIIKDYTIRLLELKQKDPLTIKSHKERTLPHGVILNGVIQDAETLGLILDECAADWGIKGRPVRFLVPDPYIVIRQIKIPGSLADDEIKGHLFMELGASIHLPFEDPVFDFILTGKEGDEKIILLFAAPEPVVRQYAELLEEARLRPVAADISPLSIYRLFHAAGQTKPDDHLLLVQADLDMMNVSVFHKDRPVFMRHLKMDMDGTEWEFTNNRQGLQEIKWGGAPEELFGQLEDAATEVERIINFYRYSLNQGREGVTAILLNGDHPELSFIEMRLAERFELPVFRINQHNVQAEGADDILPSSFYTAAGLALKEVL